MKQFDQYGHALVKSARPPMPGPLDLPAIGDGPTERSHRSVPLSDVRAAYAMGGQDR